MIFTTHIFLSVLQRFFAQNKRVIIGRYLCRCYWRMKKCFFAKLNLLWILNRTVLFLIPSWIVFKCFIWIFMWLSTLVSSSTYIFYTCLLYQLLMDFLFVYDASIVLVCLPLIIIIIRVQWNDLKIKGIVCVQWFPTYNSLRHFLCN